MDDQALVAAMAQGSRKALGDLYDLHGPLLLALGARMLGDRAEAEELLHDVFVESWRMAATYDPARGGVRTWLCTRMRSRCLDRLKSAGRSRRSSLEDLEPKAWASPAAPSTDAGRLAALLAQLPPDQRMVLELAYFDGLSSSEISAHLNVPVGTVKSRTAAALARLRQALGPA